MCWFGLSELPVGPFFGHGAGAAQAISGGARASQNRGDGSNKYLHVQPHGPPIDIFHVQLHPPIELDRAPPVDLPEASDPGPDTETAALPVLTEALIIAYGQRPRAHQAH